MYNNQMRWGLRALFFVLILSAAFRAPADLFAKTKSGKPAPAAAAPKISSSTVSGTVGLAVSTAPLRDIADVLLHFESIDHAVKSLSAEFTQNITMSETNMVQKVSGTLAYLKPDHLHLEHLRPERQTVVSDGKQIWIYRQARNQVIESNLDDWKKSDPLMDNLMDSVGSYSQLFKRYQVAFDSAAMFVTLSPKEGKRDFILRLHLSGPELFPRETELTVADMRVDTAFENVRFNPDIEKNEFNFTPPAGADVFRNFKPPRRNGEGKTP